MSLRNIGLLVLALTVLLIPYPNYCAQNQNPQTTEPKQQAEDDSSDQDQLKPIMGYRFIIQGNFSGHGKRITLTEHFLDGRTNQESPKFYQDIDYDELVKITYEKEPISIMTSDDPSVESLLIAKGGQLLGLSYVKNEGDLDGDGRDEISYVIHAADWSACNVCIIVGYRNGHWNKLASFEIHESWLPPLPEFQEQFDMFGVAGLNSTAGDEETNKKLEKQLLEFPGLITFLSPGEISVCTWNIGEGEQKIIKLQEETPIPLLTE